MLLRALKRERAEKIAHYVLVVYTDFGISGYLKCLQFLGIC